MSKRLSPTEEQHLIERLCAGDRAARDLLVAQVILPIATRRLRRKFGQSAYYEDILQDAGEGILLALERWVHTPAERRFGNPIPYALSYAKYVPLQRLRVASHPCATSYSKASQPVEVDTQLPDHRALAPELLAQLREHAQLHAKLDAVLGIRDADILRLYYGLSDQEPLTPEQIGPRVAMLPGSVRSTVTASLHRLRETAERFGPDMSVWPASPAPQKKCGFCAKVVDHNYRTCPERKLGDRLRDRTMCTNCLRPGHNITKCKEPQWRTCEKP